MPSIVKDDLNNAIRFCLENNLFNAARLIEVAHHYQKEAQWAGTGKIIVPDITIKKSLDALDFIPQVSKITTYENIL